jgi:cell division protein FtsI/penicillin-binding protein 2
MSRRGRTTLNMLWVGALSTSLIALTLTRGDSPPVAPESDVAAAPLHAPTPEPELPPRILRRLPVSRAALALRAADAEGVETGRVSEAGVTGRLFERVRLAGSGPLRVEYSLEADLTRHAFRVLQRGRVALGHVVLLDPRTGRLLVYASTNTRAFPPTRAYPAASLVKVITAAAALSAVPETARLPCRFSGDPHRLTRASIDPPKRGKTVSLRRALSTSNNQCFAQLAVHAVGRGPLVEAIERFGWLSQPAPAHAPGSVDAGEDRFGVAKLGCGLAGCRITPLHAAQLAGAMADGELVAPRWIDRVVDADGRELPIPDSATPRRVMAPELAAELREMLVETTTRGTARSAFRGPDGRPLLGSVKVAGKTGSLNGKAPAGRYEWFIGAAPAEAPRIAVAVLLVQGDLWWRNASQIAAEVLRGVFCDAGECRSDLVARWIRLPQTTTTAALAPAPRRIRN